MISCEEIPGFPTRCRIVRPNVHRGWTRSGRFREKPLSPVSVQPRTQRTRKTCLHAIPGDITQGTPGPTCTFVFPNTPTTAIRVKTPLQPNSLPDSEGKDPFFKGGTISNEAVFHKGPAFARNRFSQAIAGAERSPSPRERTPSIHTDVILRSSGKPDMNPSFPFNMSVSYTHLTLPTN